jgi:aldehyde dehydrogenase (NAD+)
MTRDIDIIANLEALDTGKPFDQAKGEVFWAIHVFRSQASFADKIFGRTIPSDGGLFSYTRKEAVGVVGLISAWNYPILLVAMKMSPAFVAGCTIIMKPAEQTPLTCLYVAALTKEAGFPDGVFNVVTGYGPTAGAAITSHKQVRKVGFTGSTEVGKLIMEAAAKSNVKKVSLELGGKSPFVVFDDVDCEFFGIDIH